MCTVLSNPADPDCGTKQEENTFHLDAAAKAQEADKYAAMSTFGSEDMKSTNLAYAAQRLAQAVQELAEQMHRDA